MITIEVNDRPVLDVLDRLLGLMGDMSPVMADVAQALASEAEQQFETQSGPSGPWEALSEDATIPMRIRAGTWPGKVLQVSGGLAASVQTSYGPDFASIGSNKVYAPMHMLGGTTAANSMIPGKTIPARPFLPFIPETGQLSPNAEATVLEILESILSRAT